MLELAQTQQHSLFQRCRSAFVATLSWIASKISVAIRSAFWRSILASVRALVRESRSVRGASAQRSAFDERRKAGAEPAVSGSTPYPSHREF
jgi:hypothetical protein